MPKCVIAISGKRKSGKDYCTKVLKKEFESRQIEVKVTGISISLKQEYAKIHNLNFAELLTDGPYKENHRKEMIKWGEEARNRDYSVFCRAAMAPFLSSDVVIVSDCRRLSDYRYFTESYRTLTVRVEASSENRSLRGFHFVEGIDDAESECGLDEYDFDVVLNNLTGGEEKLMKQIVEIVDTVVRILKE